MAEAPLRSTRSWSDIPLDVAGMLLRILPSYVDHVRFSAVCIQWHYAKKQLPLPQPLPLLLFPDGTLYSLPRSEPFCLPECTGYTIASSCGKWLVFSGDDGDCFLKDPFSKATVALPALSAVRLRCEDTEFHQACFTRVIDGIIKLRLCKPQLVAAIVSWRRFRHLALCRPGRSSWCICMSKQFVSPFADIAFQKGKLYALLFNEDLLSIDISEGGNTGNPWVSHSRQVIKGNHQASSRSPDGCNILERLYLVESGNALLMVRRKLFCRFRWSSVGFRLPGQKSMRHVVERNKFEVFEADFEQSRWAEVTTIGDDQALFLGRWCSRIVCVSQYDLLGDRIFLENNDDDHFWYDKENLSSCSAYNMKDGVLSSPLPKITGKPDTGFVTWLFP